MEEPRRLGGRYELGSVLGRGGMAEVYIAHDSRLGRTVAVKTLRVDLARDPSFQARFRREAQSAASLNHPSIVAVYDTGEDYVDGVSIPYIVMEYVDGSTLRELLHSGRKLLPERSMEMTTGILQALEYSHRAGIVHRDIKPANVMLTRTGQVKVMDFGIARAMGDAGMTMTQTAAVIGTAQYLSPEQAKGEQVDARSDLYSTGCLLFELLTVRPPFVGDSPVAVAYQHVREEPQPPSTYDPEISPEMDAIVLKALTKDPDYRYQSADEMRADIDAALDGQPVAATAAMGAMGAVGYGGYGDHPTTALRTHDAAGQTSMLPPMRDDDGGYEGDRPDRRRAGNRRNNTSTILLAAAGILVLIGAIFIGRAIFGGSPPDSVEVPNLVGDTVAEAKQSGENGNFTVSVGGKKFCEEKKGRICSQDPESGGTVERDGTVTVVVSKGVERVSVPDVRGISFGDAKSELEGKGFDVERKEVESERTPGTVAGQDPEAGTRQPKGSTITLSVATEAPKVSVPDVTNKPLDQAKAQLEAVGLKAEASTADRSDVPPNTVVSQSPGPNSEVKRGSTVTLTVAQPAEKFAMPDVRGQSVKDARKALTDAGLVVGSVVGEQGPNSTVVGTNPQPGQEVKKGDSVTLMATKGGGGGGGGFFGGTTGQPDG
ncbi:Stk1 family PASTA domain-containing Ser/Thr kinase [Streptomyces meridianus]|uniref:non-specific serine/threonine protein kinase n=1 Tax=Streptomyces meridianus TaxID=2938945 RepID=A0ABT0X7E9_9ACTN|nr:Stk1 family PASTA domain-containing Ser/Thr kinase [Streptomyces meridianus]MCM2578453.1 Stk1 family PASTA domain-containing Ser/Thr kinase [Streptomyces meridianus]